MAGQNVKTNYKTGSEKAKEDAILKRQADRVEQNRKARKEQSHPTAHKVVATAKKVAAWALSNNASWKAKQAATPSRTRSGSKKKTTTRARTRTRSSGSNSGGGGFNDPFGGADFGGEPFGGGNDRFNPPF